MLEKQLTSGYRLRYSSCNINSASIHYMPLFLSLLRQKHYTSCYGMNKALLPEDFPVPEALLLTAGTGDSFKPSVTGNDSMNRHLRDQEYSRIRIGN